MTSLAKELFELNTPDCISSKGRIPNELNISHSSTMISEQGIDVYSNLDNKWPGGGITTELGDTYSDVLIYGSCGDSDEDKIDRGNCESTTEPMIFNETVSYKANMTYARSGDTKYTGIYSWKATKSIAAGTGAFADFCDNNVGTDMHGMVAGLKYTLSAWVYIPSSGGPLNTEVALYIYDYDAGWASTSQAAAATYDQWQLITVTRTLRSTAVATTLRLNYATAMSINEYVYIDDVELIEYRPPMIWGEVVPNIFNALWERSGDTAHSGNYSYKLTKTIAAGTYGRVAIVENSTSTDAHGVICGQTYKLSAWIYIPSSGGPKGEECYIDLEDYEGSWKANFQSFKNVYDEWQYVELIRNMSSDSDGFYSAFNMSTTGDSGEYYYVDDVKLEVVSIESKKENNLVYHNWITGGDCEVHDAAEDMIVRGNCEGDTPTVRWETTPFKQNALWAISGDTSYEGDYSYKLTKTIAPGTSGNFWLVDGQVSTDMHGFLATYGYVWKQKVYIPSSGGPDPSEVKLYISEYYSAAWHGRNLATLTTWPEQQKITASDAASDDRFGHSVSIGDSWYIVGAYDEHAEGFPDRGSAYLYKRTGDSWGNEVKLTASDGDSNDEFGYSVSIGDSWCIVSSHKDNDNGPDSGSAYLYKRTGDSWGNEVKLTASDGDSYDYFGYSVAIKGDWCIVGVYRENSYTGASYLYKRTGDSWGNEVKITASDAAASDQFGYSVSIGDSWCMVGAYRKNSYTGAVYLYKLTAGDSWGNEVKLTASGGETYDYFGVSVSMGDSWCMSGAHSEGSGTEGSAYLYKRIGDSWSNEVKITSSDGTTNDRFGYSVSMDDSWCMVGAYYNSTGSAYVYKYDDSVFDSWQDMTACWTMNPSTTGFIVLCIIDSTGDSGEYIYVDDIECKHQNDPMVLGEIYSTDRSDMKYWERTNEITPYNGEYCYKYHINAVSSRIEFNDTLSATDLHKMNPMETYELSMKMYIPTGSGVDQGDSIRILIQDYNGSVWETSETFLGDVSFDKDTWIPISVTRQLRYNAVSFDASIRESTGGTDAYFYVDDIKLETKSEKYLIAPNKGQTGKPTIGVFKATTNKIILPEDLTDGWTTTNGTSTLSDYYFEGHRFTKLEWTTGADCYTYKTVAIPVFSTTGMKAVQFVAKRGTSRYSGFLMYDISASEWDYMIHIDWLAKSVWDRSMYTSGVQEVNNGTLVSQEWFGDDVVRIKFLYYHSNTANTPRIYLYAGSQGRADNPEGSTYYTAIMLEDSTYHTPYATTSRSAGELVYPFEWTQKGTVECWVRPWFSYDFWTNRYFVSDFQGSHWHFFFRYSQTDDRFELAFYDSVTTIYLTAGCNDSGIWSSSNVFTENTYLQKWIHFKLTWDTVNDNYKFYVNGVLIDSDTTVLNSIPFHENISIGSIPLYSSSPHEGDCLITDFSYKDYVDTSDDHYNKDKPYYVDNRLMGKNYNWRLDEFSNLYCNQVVAG